MLTVTVTGSDGVWFEAEVNTEVVASALLAACLARTSHVDIVDVNVHVDQ